jgi:hypothetical protein
MLTQPAPYKPSVRLVRRESIAVARNLPVPRTYSNSTTVEAGCIEILIACNAIFLHGRLAGFCASFARYSGSCERFFVSANDYQ